MILFAGNEESSMNYKANYYHFRQDSSFLYFFGINRPGFFGVCDVDSGRDILYGDNFTMDDIIWMGDQPTVKELAAEAATLPGEIIAAPGDVSQSQEVQAVVEQALSHYDRIDVLVNNAGVELVKPVDEVTDALRKRGAAAYLDSFGALDARPARRRNRSSGPGHIRFFQLPEPGQP